MYFGLYLQSLFAICAWRSCFISLWLQCASINGLLRLDAEGCSNPTNIQFLLTCTYAGTLITPRNYSP